MQRAKIPRYHLNSPISHGIRPLQLRTNKRSSIVRYDNGYSRCSLSASAGYPVRIRSRCKAPRPCSKKPSISLPTCRDSLRRISSPTLLFTAFMSLTVCILFLSRTFVNTLFLSQTQTVKQLSRLHCSYPFLYLTVVQYPPASVPYNRSYAPCWSREHWRCPLR